MVLQASLLCQHADSDRCSHECNNALGFSREHLMNRQRSSAFNSLLIHTLLMNDNVFMHYVQCDVMHEYTKVQWQFSRGLQQQW